MNKKFISSPFLLVGIFLNFSLLFTTPVALADGFSGSGAGTSNNPFIITSCLQLQEMNNNLSASYKLNSDIDCSATSTWNSGAGFLPIENTDYPPSPFTGNFDGNGRKITGLFIHRPGTLYTGLFGKIASGSIVKNVGLENVNITGGSSTSGGLAGMNIGIISNSYSTGNVSGDYYVGGLSGMNGGTISNSYSMVNVLSVISGSSVGGLVGANNAGTISKSYSTGSVSGTTVGGLVGDSFNAGTITNSFWDTQTSGQGASAGGTGVTGESTVNMQTGSTFTSAGWNFTTIWDIKSFANNGYPFLRATTGAVTTTGGTVVYGFWNSSNTGLSIIVPIANDANLVGGKIQARVDYGDGIFRNLGPSAPYTIVSGDLNTNKTLSFIASDFEVSESFSEGETNIGFTVVITDNSSNETTYARSADTLTVDQIAPTVTNVTSTLANGTYTTGQVVPINVTFSEPVIVTTNPQLNLSTGNPETTLADYSSGSGSDTLTFNYTVSAGNTSDDLDYSATNAINFVVSGSTIKDAEGNQTYAFLFNPGAEGSLGYNKDIVIDTAVGTVVLSRAIINNSNRDQIVIITYNVSMNPSSVPTIAFNGDDDLKITNFSHDAGAWSHTTVDNDTWTQTFTSTTTLQMTGIILASSGATDLAGNPESPSINGTNNPFDIDTQAPSTPIANPVANTYISAQSVVLSSEGSTSIMYSTTEDYDPSNDICNIAPKYHDPIPVTSFMTIRAVGCDDAGNKSPMGTFVYTIVTPPSTPIATPTAGTYTSAQSVTLSSDVSDFLVSTDGSDVSESICFTGVHFVNPILVTSSLTIKAVACDADGNKSPLGTFVYTIDTPQSNNYSSGGGYLPGYGPKANIISVVSVAPGVNPIIKSLSSNSILGSGKCSPELIITDNMENGNRNGVYSEYNKGTVKQIAILQAHINRILAGAYKEAAGPIDGIYGKLTKQGVERLQKALNNLHQSDKSLIIDGVIGSYTKESINNSCGNN